MTRQQIIDKHIDRLAGPLLEAWSKGKTADGEELSRWLRVKYPKLRDLIGDIVDDAANTNGHASNGVAVTKRN